MKRGARGLRFADRYVGIPLIAAAGAVKRRRELPDRIARIGVLNSTNMGDTVILSPVLADIAAAYPDADVLLFAGGANASLAPLLPAVRPVPIALGSPRSAIRAIRAARLDVLLDFDSWPRIEPVYAIASGARFCAGFRAAAQHRHFAFDRWVDHRPKTHELDNYRALATVLGVESTSLPRVAPPGVLGPDEAPARDYVVFHQWPAGFRNELKRWARASWLALAQDVVDRGCDVVLTGGPADVQDTAAFVAAAPAQLRPHLVDTSGRFGLGPVTDLLAGARAVVSVNTGVMHLAAATGVPTISLNGPTDPVRWGPMGERAYSVNSALDGCGYLYYGWEYNGQRTDCMDGIAVERVSAALDGVLAAA